MNYWTTKQGIKIPFSQLQNSHLLNIIKMFMRASENHNEKPEERCECFLELWNLAEARGLELPNYKPTSEYKPDDLEVDFSDYHPWYDSGMRGNIY